MFMEKRIPKLGSEILEQASTWFIDFNENQVDLAGREDEPQVIWSNETVAHTRRDASARANRDDQGLG